MNGIHDNFDFDWSFGLDFIGRKGSLRNSKAFTRKHKIKDNAKSIIRIFYGLKRKTDEDIFRVENHCDNYIKLPILKKDIRTVRLYTIEPLASKFYSKDDRLNRRINREQNYGFSVYIYDFFASYKKKQIIVYAYNGSFFDFYSNDRINTDFQIISPVGDFDASKVFPKIDNSNIDSTRNTFTYEYIQNRTATRNHKYFIFGRPLSEFDFKKLSHRSTSKQSKNNRKTKKYMAKKRRESERNFKQKILLDIDSHNELYIDNFSDTKALDEC